MKAVVLAVLASVWSVSSWGEDALGSVKYREAFYGNALASLTRVMSSNPQFANYTPEQRDGLLARMAEGFANCHMSAMAAYSPDIQAAAYNVIEAGGSYPEAKQALELAIATEGSAGGEREAAVSEMLQEAAAIGQECIARVKQSTQVE